MPEKKKKKATLLHLLLVREVVNWVTLSLKFWKDTDRKRIRQ